ncbi:MAG: hypothetical protein IJH55_05265 [Romboutsia sp.]|nr:hypothetical protein [Romboutsia sp.]
MKDFKLDMQIYDYKNDKHEINDKFSKLKYNQLCFIQDLDVVYDIYDDEYQLSWYDTRRSVSNILSLKNATSRDIEQHIKECFDYYDMKYNHVKVKLL